MNYELLNINYKLLIGCAVTPHGNLYLIFNI